jgi:hypothetical protein
MPEAGAIHSISGGQWLDLETGNDSFRFKASSAAAARKKKETTHVLTPA